MRIADMITDVAAYAVEKVQGILFFIFNLVLDLLRRLFDKFLGEGIPGKVIFLNTIPALFAVVLPVAKFYVFESYFYVNNPLAVYMIGITILMFGSLYLTWRYMTVVQIVVNAYYLFWVIYIPYVGSFTKADPHQICAGYYVNIAVPVVYMLAAAVDYFWE